MNYLWILLLLAFYIQLNSSAVRFTNLKCETIHPDFVSYEVCSLRVITRGVIGLSIYAKMWQLPVNNISINLSLFKKLNGYRPFLYNFSVDMCKFFKNPKKYPFVQLYHRIIVNESNINHTCPYNHDLIVKDVFLDESKFKNLPLPRGEYRFDLKVSAYNDLKGEIKAYIDISRDL
ncbi:uncharacterized protein LOC131806263 [Musca domestica]|uniref:Uncharacterized protein LOC131806263 n=1 Tax=Musca domestica TaxID=7370 RepID=A0ABM3VK65_MUSDO|nr:uncharacterized protein LOC131806263 [Musca domestica]